MRWRQTLPHPRLPTCHESGVSDLHDVTRRVTSGGGSRAKSTVCYAAKTRYKVVQFISTRKQNCSWGYQWAELRRRLGLGQDGCDRMCFMLQGKAGMSNGLRGRDGGRAVMQQKWSFRPVDSCSAKDEWLDPTREVDNSRCAT
jgi:hypothetical protein